MPRSPKTIGLTGGIASGKSFVCRLLQERGYPVFSCDPEAKRLIRTDPDLQAELRKVVGPELYDPAGTLRKDILAAYLCQGPRAADRVNRLVHPRVAQAWKDWKQAQALSPSGPPLLFMECALLFESGFNALVDESWLVFAPFSIRLARVIARDRISPARARAWMDLQWPDEVKAARATRILPNDGLRPLPPLLDELLAQALDPARDPVKAK